MEELRQTIQEHGIRYQLEGDYYLPVLELPKENRPIGRWGRLHKAYLKTTDRSGINHCFCPGSFMQCWPT